jgi:hypothetical protein
VLPTQEAVRASLSPALATEPKKASPKASVALANGSFWAFSAETLGGSENLHPPRSALYAWRAKREANQKRAAAETAEKATEGVIQFLLTDPDAAARHGTLSGFSGPCQNHAPRG